MKQNQSIKKELYKFFNNNPEKSKKEIAEHFISMGYAKSSVYRWIDLVENGDTLERKVGSGRPVKIATNGNIKDIIKKFNHRSGCSQRSVARKKNCNQSTISRILKKYSNIKCYKKAKKAAMTELQKKQARPKCRKMLEKFKNLDFIIDDESYFTLTNSDQPGNDRFYSDDIKKTPDDVKYYYKAKYEKKILVWICISPKGVSKPLFIPSGLAVNQNVYLEKMIQHNLEPFINEYYKKGGYVFWPDLASAHYAKKVVNYLNEKKINFVPKNINPANVPKARPIEDFWANLKREVYKGGWAANNLDVLKNRIKYCLSKIEISVVQKHAESVNKRLDHIRRYGV